MEERLSAGLDLLVTYTFSKAMDDSSASDNTFLGGSTSLQDPNKPYLERSVSLFDIPQQFQFTHVYDLPFGRGKHLAAISIRLRTHFWEAGRSTERGRSSAAIL
jgi:hypothetical protein